METYEIRHFAGSWSILLALTRARAGGVQSASREKSVHKKGRPANRAALILRVSENRFLAAAGGAAAVLAFVATAVAGHEAAAFRAERGIGYGCRERKVFR